LSSLKGLKKGSGSAEGDTKRMLKRFRKERIMLPRGS